MNKIKDCKFCKIQHGQYMFDEIDIPIAENNSYLAVASIGALVEGWTLIIPKEHILSLKEKYNKLDFIEFINLVKLRISSKYGKVIIFEHGANNEGSITSCGTDHAHLHIVPFQDSLLPQMMNDKFEWMQSFSSDIMNISNNSEYLFYVESSINENWIDPQGYLHILQNPISQYFRKLIANKIGLPDKSDYKFFLYKENALLTKRKLSTQVK